MEKKTQKSASAADPKKPNSNPAMDYFSDFSAKSESESTNEFGEMDFGKLEIKVEDMFKSGVHFGHHKSRKNPKMNKYVFATKNNINIIDLEKTKEKLKEAMDFISKNVFEGKDILFVGTKKQAKRIVASAARVCEMPYVTERWLGGTFTNYETISKRTAYLREGLEKVKNGGYAKYTKFEQMKKAEELSRLDRKMGGIKNMIKLPGAIFVTSVIEDVLAVKEAKNRNIPIVAIVDTNVNPSDVDFPIPANEDAVSSLRLIMSYIAKAVLEGKEKKGILKMADEKKMEDKK